MECGILEHFLINWERLKCDQPREAAEGSPHGFTMLIAKTSPCATLKANILDINSLDI
jgi:hypothetical protein